MMMMMMFMIVMTVLMIAITVMTKTMGIVATVRILKKIQQYDL